MGPEYGNSERKQKALQDLLKEDISEWFCDCENSVIRWVDEEHPHPAINAVGWYCMGCLSEFTKNANYPATP